MYDIPKIRLLNEVFLKAIPQKVDYESHNGQYCIELLSIQPVYIGCNQCREFMVSGNLEKNVISATLKTKGEVLFSVFDLPYIANEGDRTPIYKIVRASVLFAYGTLRLPFLYQNLKKIPVAHCPFGDLGQEGQAKQEIDFMNKLSAICQDKTKYTKSQVILIYPTSSKLREIINFYDKEEKEERATRQKINESINVLKPFAPNKEDVENATPDVFVWQYDTDYPKEKIDNLVVVLNTNGSDKERFWWDYLKLNLYLSDVEYSFSYYLLMNRWKLSTIQKWIAEYRTNGFYESNRAKNYMVICLKTTDKSPIRILNSDGSVTKVRVSR